MNDKIIHIKVDSLFEAIVPEYLEGIREHTESIEKFLLTENYEGIRTLGHNMKGSGGGYGFNRITELGSWIEAAAKEKHSLLIKKYNEEIVHYLKNINIEYISD